MGFLGLSGMYSLKQNSETDAVQQFFTAAATIKNPHRQWPSNKTFLQLRKNEGQKKAHRTGSIQGTAEICFRLLLPKKAQNHSMKCSGRTDSTVLGGHAMGESAPQILQLQQDESKVFNCPWKPSLKAGKVTAGDASHYARDSGRLLLEQTNTHSLKRRD